MNTLLLSGWTQPIDALASIEDDATLFDYSDYASPNAAIAAMAQLNPSRIVAWSMGGQLALRAIAAKAIQPKHLTLIATPMQFVTSLPPPEGEPHSLLGDSVGVNKPIKNTPIKGMDPMTYQLFRESYVRDPARAKTRFHGLVAKGGRDMKRVMGLLGHHPHVEDVERWLPWLDDLAAYRLDASALAFAPPTLIIHGMNDAIVPFAQSEHLVRALPHAQVNAWADVGHAPHVHDAARARLEIATHRQLHGGA